MVDTIATRLAAIDVQLVGHRRLYWLCLDAGHDGESQWHEVEIDRLLGLRLIVQRGPLTATQEPA